MRHLSDHRLAALADEPPTAEEAAHLAGCARCADEQRAYTTLVDLAHALREPLALPLTRWESIAAALDRVQGGAGAPAPVSVPAPGADRAFSRRRWLRGTLRSAAAVLIFVAGLLSGRTSAGGSRRSGAEARPSGAAGAAVRTAGSRSDTLFDSPEQARTVQAEAERRYQQAVAYLAHHDTTAVGDDSPLAFRSRLAALDRVISTTREAMRQAPHDPVINGYYLTTLGQREATLRQLNVALPASLRVNSF